jgi:hypothetical protein
MSNQQQEVKGNVKVVSSGGKPGYIDTTMTVTVDSKQKGANGEKLFRFVLDNPFKDVHFPLLSLTFSNDGRLDRFGRKIQDRSGLKRQGRFRFLCNEKMTAEKLASLTFHARVFHYVGNIEGEIWDWVTIEIISPFPSDGIDNLKAYIKKPEVLGEFEIVVFRNVAATPAENLSF